MVFVAWLNVKNHNTFPLASKTCLKYLHTANNFTNESAWTSDHYQSGIFTRTNRVAKKTKFYIIFPLSYVSQRNKEAPYLRDLVDGSRVRGK